MIAFLKKQKKIKADTKELKKKSTKENRIGSREGSNLERKISSRTHYPLFFVSIFSESNFSTLVNSTRTKGKRFFPAISTNVSGIYNSTRNFLLSLLKCCVLFYSADYLQTCHIDTGSIIYIFF